MPEFCSRCGEKLDGNKQFCPKCGLKKGEDVLINKKSNNISIPKKYIILIIIVIIIAFIGSVLYINHGDVTEIPYSILPHKINIDSVDEIQSEQLSPSEYSDYNGVAKAYKISYTAKENLNNVSIEVFAYTSNNDALDVMANFFGLNSLNTLKYKDNLVMGKTETSNVLFGMKNATDFDISYFKVFVYKETPDGQELIDKFTYNI